MDFLKIFQPHVIDASVILATKSAEVKVSLASSGSSKGEIGQALAKHLSNCGFESRVRGTMELTNLTMKVFWFF